MYSVKTLIKVPVKGEFVWELYVLTPRPYEEARDYADRLERGMTAQGYEHFEFDDDLYASLRKDNTTVHIKIEEE